ncbi:MAG: PqqD family peptide modification chaperone [Sphingomonas sp.]
MNIPSATDDDTVLSRPANLVASEIDGEMVILNVDSGYFFQLNQIGSRIWEALDTPMTVGALCRTMQGRFDVDPETCLGDVTAFVGSLIDNDLVTVEPRAG